MSVGSARIYEDSRSVLMRGASSEQHPRPVRNIEQVCVHVPSLLSLEEQTDLVIALRTPPLTSDAESQQDVCCKIEKS